MAEDTAPGLTGIRDPSLLRDGHRHRGVIGLHANRANAREPFPYSAVVFRDPDNIQLELIWSLR
jgi:hypothetical protein